MPHSPSGAGKKGLPERPRPRSLDGARPARVARALRGAGGEMRTTDIVAKLLDEMEDPYDKGRDKFWRVVDSILRRGAEIGHFERKGGANWRLTPQGEAYFLEETPTL